MFVAPFADYVFNTEVRDKGLETRDQTFRKLIDDPPGSSTPHIPADLRDGIPVKRIV